MSYRKAIDSLSGSVRDDMVIRIADEAHIPADPHNADWQAYQAWLKAGNAPSEPAAPTPDQLG